MSAQCAICYEKFGFFRKTLSCPKCRLAICKRCLKDKVCLQCALPKVNYYDEPPKNLYDNPLSKMSKERNVMEITEKMATLPPPNQPAGYQEGKKEELEIERRLQLLRGNSNKPSKPPVRLMSINHEAWFYSRVAPKGLTVL